MNYSGRVEEFESLLSLYTKKHTAATKHVNAGYLEFRYIYEVPEVLRLPGTDEYYVLPHYYLYHEKYYRGCAGEFVKFQPDDKYILAFRMSSSGPVPTPKYPEPTNLPNLAISKEDAVKIASVLIGNKNYDWRFRPNIVTTAELQKKHPLHVDISEVDDNGESEIG